MALAATIGVGDQVVDEHMLAARQGVCRPTTRQRDKRSIEEPSDELIARVLLVPDFGKERVRRNSLAQEGHQAEGRKDVGVGFQEPNSHV